MPHPRKDHQQPHNTWCSKLANCADEYFTLENAHNKSPLENMRILWKTGRRRCEADARESVLRGLQTVGLNGAVSLAHQGRPHQVRAHQGVAVGEIIST